MRHLLVSDIHSNIEAMDVCLARAEKAGFDSVLCCGDIVGYGPDPNDAVDRIRELTAVTIRGNHDRVSCGQDEPTDFNPYAKAAALWTRAALTPATNDYLQALPVGPLDVGAGAQMVHGAITDEDDYIMGESHALENFLLSEFHVTFFGHSHFQIAFSCDESGNVAVETVEEADETSATLPLKPEKQYLINPGSVGQPRDGDSRAGFAIWDVDQSRLEFHRMEYPIGVTQKKMQDKNLPPDLIDRLSHGR